MNAGDIEAIYEAMALELDRHDEDKVPLLLAKLALLLSQEIGDKDVVLRCLEDAGREI